MSDDKKASREFSKALHNFTQDFASGDAIRHLADLGYTAFEIHDRLLYPTPVRQIGEIMWKHFVQNGTILLNDPASLDYSSKTSYESRKDEYGKTYFIRVSEEGEAPDPAQYYKCEYGKMIYKDSKAFDEYISVLDKRESDYIRYLTWPLTPVWHRLDDNFKKIVSKLDNQV